jgi:hypothetical protein
VNEEDDSNKNHDIKDDDEPDDNTNNDLHNFLLMVGSLKE